MDQAPDQATYMFTVFTPTYNRAETLPQVYDSLRKQTYRDFEWLIVDDGSTDPTRDLVTAWAKEADFPIRYYWQENQGKHVAFNRAVQEARGTLFLPFDSDDMCVPDALARLLYHWNSIPLAERHSYAGVTALCVDQEGRLIGDPLPQPVVDSNCLEMTTRGLARGDMWGFQRTDVLRDYPFPVFPGERFIVEGVVWNRIGAQYKTRYVNEALRVVEYLSDGLTTSIDVLRARNPHGARLYYRELARSPIPKRWLVRSLVNYIRFSMHARIAFLKILTESGHALLTLLLVPGGFLYYKKDERLLLRNRQTSRAPDS